jgi:flagella synthesis protein FlgN
MDASSCLEQLSRLLAEETALLGLLEQQLQNEHTLLTKNDVDGLEAAGSARQDSIAKLLRLDDERRDLCRLLGHSPDNAGMAALLKSCDPARRLASAYERSSQQARRCREQNDRNGALVSARMSRVNSMLGWLNAGNEKERVYHAQHSNRSAAAKPGRLVSTSA